MKKIVVFVLGPDRPGIIAAVSATLFGQGCNLEDVTHTTLQTEFVGIFLAEVPAQLRQEDLFFALQGALSRMRLFVHLRPVEEVREFQPPASEPFVITTFGPDRPGLVAGITEVLARFEVNISNMKAVPRVERDHQDYVMFYEVDIPSAVDQRAFRAALLERAAELGLDLNLQHREIFEELHRV
jgi:glycine cleavage system transcriptional repressor